jgi:hypothetical protein
MNRILTVSALAALVVVGAGRPGPAFAQDKADPRATTGTTANPVRGPLPQRFNAPIGHRQPTAQDLPSDIQQGESGRTSDDKALDEALKGICRGC